MELMPSQPAGRVSQISKRMRQGFALSQCETMVLLEPQQAPTPGGDSVKPWHFNWPPVCIVYLTCAGASSAWIPPLHLCKQDSQHQVNFDMLLLMRIVIIQFSSGYEENANESCFTSMRMNLGPKLGILRSDKSCVHLPL